MKFFSIIIALIKFSTKRILENRFAALSSLFFVLANLGLQLVLFRIIYSFGSSINGWSQHDLYFILGAYQIFDCLVGLSFEGGVQRLPDMVNKGDLDYILTRPAPAQLLISLSRIRVNEILNVIPGFLLLFYAKPNMELVVFLTFCLSLVCGVAIFYSIFFMVATISIYAGKFDSLSSVRFLLSSPLSLPTEFYGSTLSWGLRFIFPYAFILTIPAKIGLSKEPLTVVTFSIMIAIGLMAIATFFWRRAMSNYTSASS